MKKMLTLMMTLLMVFSLVACGGKKDSASDERSKDETEKDSISIDEGKNRDDDSSSAVKGTKYTYLHDKWNLYIATILSKNTIKVEKWYRFDASEDGDPFKHEADVCILKTNDTSIDFKWLDNKQTAFSVKMRDSENCYWETESIVGFSIEDSNSEVLGANFSDKGENYTYLHDKWNLYKAVVLSNSIIKIEQWGRMTAGEDGDPFKYEADICLIETRSDDYDFEWVDDEHTSFTITMQDLNNSYWEEPETVVFVIE